MNETFFRFFCLATMIGCLSCNSHPAPVVPPEKKVTAAPVPGDMVSPPPPPSSRIDPADILKEKELRDYIISAPVISPNKKSGTPFNMLGYDKLIAYDFDGSEESYGAVIDAEGKFVPVVIKQQYLTQPQADKITTLLSSNSTYGDGTAACFEPHLALVFYKNDSMVNQVNICLGCNYLISTIDIPATTYVKMNKGTKLEYGLSGFTAKGKKGIVSLCKELNFYYGGGQTD